ncbi:hypothetical protein GGR57DRAFT_487094 [Xylariaceae sp. FL1272]|nr:hypothetical protein GGR57DRAFT_487094 [Xylariaceae sp. FL1272]
MTTRPPETDLGTVTSWLPVTTRHPAYAQCTDGFAVYSAYTSLDQSLYRAPTLWRPKASNLYVTDRCLPREATTSSNSQWFVDDGLSTYISLGPVVCPEAYYTALTEELGTTTSLFCCPSSFTLSYATEYVTHYCASYFTEG